MLIIYKIIYKMIVSSTTVNPVTLPVIRVGANFRSEQKRQTFVTMNMVKQQ